MRSFCKNSSLFSITNIGVFQLLTYETLTNDVFSFEQLGPRSQEVKVSPFIFWSAHCYLIGLKERFDIY